MTAQVEKPRVGVVVTHPIQHFCPLYRALTDSGKIELRIFFASDAGSKPFFDEDFSQTIRFQEDLLTGFQYEFLPEHATGPLRGSLRNPNLVRRLEEYSPDVVQVNGYYHGISRDALGWAKRTGRPVLMWADSELLRPRSPLKQFAKKIVLPHLLKRFDGFLTTGENNEDYYYHYGVPRDRMFRCTFPVDERKLSPARTDRRGSRQFLLKGYGAGEDSILALIVGKLVAGKSVDHAIEAIAAASRSGLRDRIVLIIAGDGPERSNLASLAEKLETNTVRFAGFVDVDRLPQYYAGADFLIHSSAAEAHSLAISEAIFCGLPIIASDRVGSVGKTDDVRVGVNGLVYPWGDVQALTRHIVHLCTHGEERDRFRAASQQIGEERTLTSVASAYNCAVSMVLERQRTNRGESTKLRSGERGKRSDLTVERR